MNYAISVLLVLNFFVSCTPVFAQDMPFTGVNPRGLVAGEFATTGGKSPYEESKLQLNVPVIKGEKSTWLATARGNLISLDDTMIIADRGYEIPKDFGGADVGFAASFPGEKVNRGFSASVGTTGRSLLDDDNSRVYSATYFSDWKAANGNSWYFFVSYSNNRTVFNNIPLPGVAYGINRETFRFMAGFPFVFVWWAPKPWMFTASASPFHTGVEGAYLLHGPWQFAAGGSWQPRSFQNLAPDINDERLLFDKKEWTIGPRMSFGPANSLSLMYVYQFDRRFFIGKSLTERNSTATELADAGGLQLKFRASF